MPLLGRHQTFALENCRDLLAKLEREIDRYKTVEGRDDDEPAAIYDLVNDLKDSAFNTAVTAEQMSDWVYNDMTAEQRQKLGFKTLLDLQLHVREKCRALYLCRHAATASKHWEVSKFPDPEVKVEVWHDDNGWTSHFIDAGKATPALLVFEQAFAFWDDFIRRHGIGKVLGLVDSHFSSSEIITHMREGGSLIRRSELVFLALHDDQPVFLVPIAIVDTMVEQGQIAEGERGVYQLIGGAV